MNRLFLQIGKFGLVGLFCFFVEYLLLILFTDGFGLNYLYSNVIAFLTSTVVNYFLSTKYVFIGDKRGEKTKFIIFVLLSVLALGINQLVMWLGVEQVGLDYKLVKLFAAGVVMVFNFITRKLLLE